MGQSPVPCHVGPSKPQMCAFFHTCTTHPCVFVTGFCCRLLVHILELTCFAFMPLPTAMFAAILFGSYTFLPPSPFCFWLPMCFWPSIRLICPCFPSSGRPFRALCVSCHPYALCRALFFCMPARGSVTVMTVYWILLPRNGARPLSHKVKRKASHTWLEAVEPFNHSKRNMLDSLERSTKTTACS